MIHYLSKIGWITCAFIFSLSSLSFGSGGSLISAGAFGEYNGGDTGHRQFIRLRSNGKLLSATPQNCPIKLITLFAPGLTGGNLIVREFNLRNGETSVLISTPHWVGSRIERATVFLSCSASACYLYQEHETGWKRFEPIKLITREAPIGDDADEMWAYSVHQLGHFRISSGSHRVQTDRVLAANIGAFPMGSLRIGVFPWICAGTLFIIIGVLSYIIHKIESKRAG